MEKEKIIAAFMKNGKLLSEEALNFLADKNIEDYINEQYTSFVLSSSSFFPKDRINIIKNLAEKKKEITTEDFIHFYDSKYEKMKNIIIGRIQKDFLSLNKLNTRRDEVHIIGIVKEIKEKDNKIIIELEDKTATVSVIFDKEEAEGLEMDDVVAVKAVSAGSVLFGKKILYPDIPLRQPTKGTGKACFISDLHLDEAPEEDFISFLSWFEKQDIKYLFVAGDTGDDKKFEKLINEYCLSKKAFVIPGNIDSDDYPQVGKQFSSKHIQSLSNPSIVEINGITILLIHNMKIDMLKKRYLGRSKTMLPEDFLTLEEIPDIVHFGHTHEAQIINYKSVTLVNSGSLLTQFKPVVVDFSTREANFSTYQESTSI